jgi:hypothetical protein
MARGEPRRCWREGGEPQDGEKARRGAPGVTIARAGMRACAADDGYDRHVLSLPRI